MNKATMVCLVAAGFLLLAGSAQAEVVEFWDYSLDAVFVNSSLTNYPGRIGTEFLVDSRNALDDGYTLTWGAPNGGQSSLLIYDLPVEDPVKNGNVIAGMVETYEGGGAVPNSFWAAGIRLGHENHEIPSNYNTLDNTTLALTVSLAPQGGSGNYTDAFTVFVEFAETPNEEPHPDDVFALTQGFPDFNFEYEGNDYYVNVFPTPDGAMRELTLEDKIAAGLDPTIPYLGFTTVENGLTMVDFAFTVSTRPITPPIPEPSTMLLLGSGLLGLAVYGRRKLH